jgi:hypothetical protein
MKDCGIISCRVGALRLNEVVYRQIPLLPKGIVILGKCDFEVPVLLVTSRREYRVVPICASDLQCCRPHSIPDDDTLGFSGIRISRQRDPLGCRIGLNPRDNSEAKEFGIELNNSFGGWKPVRDMSQEAPRGHNLANLLVHHKALSEDSEKDGLKKRVAGLKRRYRLQCHLGDDSIKNFTDSYRDELAAECAGKLADLARALSATYQCVEAHPAS